LLILAVLIATITARATGALAAPHTSARANVRGDRVVRYARTFVGIRYRYGGESPRTGFDCSGFVRFVYRHFGIDLPHYSVAQFGLGRRVARGRLKPGDLVFFSGLGHVGLYVGKGRFIHSPRTGRTVTVEPLASHGRYVGARRILHRA
jgi:cell wall-associated NlpC family hydrolase